MIGRARGGWQRFRASRPGHRFQERYRRRQRSSGGRLGSAAYLIGGSVLAIASLLLAPLPGPGMLTVLLGLGMVAGEFRPGARLLDRGEVRARRLARWVGGHLEVVRRGEGLGRLGGRDLRRRGPQRGLPLAFRRLTASSLFAGDPPMGTDRGVKADSYSPMAWAATNPPAPRSPPKHYAPPPEHRPPPPRKSQPPTRPAAAALSRRGRFRPTCSRSAGTSRGVLLWGRYPRGGVPPTSSHANASTSCALVRAGNTATTRPSSSLARAIGPSSSVRFSE